MPLREGNVPSIQVQRAILLRILRYVSPRPWGSPAAEAHRRKVNLDGIGRNIWSLPSGEGGPHSLGSFTLGSEVKWRPVVLTSTKGAPSFKYLRVEDPHPAPHKLGWLATRQPPPREHSDGLTVDITDQLRSTLANKGQSFSMSYDGRFQLSFSVNEMELPVSQDLVDSNLSISVQLCKRWMVPELVITHSRDGRKECRSLWASSELPSWVSLIPFRSLGVA